MEKDRKGYDILKEVQTHVDGEESWFDRCAEWGKKLDEWCNNLLSRPLTYIHKLYQGVLSSKNPVVAKGRIITPFVMLIGSVYFSNWYLEAAGLVSLYMVTMKPFINSKH